jgi:hypothetical protein
MNFTDQQIAGFKAVLEREYGREFTNAEVLDALIRVTRLIEAVSKQAASGGSGDSGHAPGLGS